MGFRAVLVSDVQGPSQLVSGGIDVLSFSWGIDNSIKSWAPTPSGTAQVHDFNFTKLFDASSPTLWTNCANAVKLSSVELQLFQASGSDTPSQFASIKFTDAYISHIAPGGSAGDGDGNYPMESVSLNFDQVAYSYGDANGGFNVGTGGITGQ